MIQKILLPKLGQTMEEAVIAKWHKAEGDEVRKGEVICEITTDKATLEVESYGAGVLRNINAPAGAEVAVNEQIGVLADPDEEIPQEALDYVAKPAVKDEAPAAPRSPLPLREGARGRGESRRESPPTPTLPLKGGGSAPGSSRPQAPPPAAPPPYEVPAAPFAGSRLMITPRARKIARERGLGWRFLVGSGPNGRIRERDVLAYEAEVKPVATPAAMTLAAEKHVDLRQVPPTGPGGRVSEDDVRRAEPSLIAGGFERHEMSAMRLVIAQRMSWSARVIPQFSLAVSVDMSAASGLRERSKEEGSKVSFTDLLVKAVALALREFPDVASLYDSGTLIRRGGLNVGIAVGLDDGLIVPVIRNADKRTLVELSAAAKELIDRARSNRLTPDEYTDGVITVSNLGMLGVDEFRALVNPGESAIVACGTITNTVVVAEDGEFVARPVMKVTGSFDHRTVDGATGARFLARVKELLEAPEELA